MVSDYILGKENSKLPYKHLRTHLSGKDELNHQNDQPPTAIQVT